MFTNQAARITPHKLETQHLINWRYKKKKKLLNRTTEQQKDRVNDFQNGFD